MRGAGSGRRRMSRPAVAAGLRHDRRVATGSPRPVAASLPNPDTKRLRVRRLGVGVRPVRETAMLDRITARFDALYSPTALAENRQPPAGTAAFFRYFLDQFRGALWARFVFVAIGAVADAMMPVFVGWIVGMLATTAPGDLWAEHGGQLMAILAVVLLRPVSFFADQLARNHALTPNLVDLVRWQSHWHVVRQSWTFFQNDFAGRIGTKVMQAGEAIEMAVNTTIDAVWYAVVFLAVAVVVLAGMDPLLLVPIAIWLVAYAALFRWGMPRIDALSEEVSEARSVMTGRMVDSYANIQTLKTFADDGEEDAYVAEAVTAHVGVFRRLMQVFTLSRPSPRAARRPARSSRSPPGSAPASAPAPPPSCRRARASGAAAGNRRAS
ncbi:hypothetical protein CNY89_00195 [Amaricoccus sp. HAR-UPW-R2A-40]|nr:hypothetical protein CNY89_00195 [Amaricoccus sp. HAR-UPW-R2A-40]